MSINVTVSGNPISIKRGRMITSDWNPSKEEYDKRRLMRLEQVRQQSKDIAENIRNKLKKGKSKRLSEIESDGEIKFKHWQARKLLDLQNQYQEALDEIGLGHNQAMSKELEDEAYIDQQQDNEIVARERGRIAAEKLQIEKNERNLKKAVPIQRKQLSKDVENARSTIVSKWNKGKSTNKKRKLKKAQTQSSDNEIENKVPELFLSEESICSSTDLEPRNFSESRKDDFIKVSKEQQTSKSIAQEDTSEKAVQTLPEAIFPMQRAENVPLDTRISERIRRREVLDSNCCDIDTELPVKSLLGVDSKCACCQCPEKQNSKHIEVQTEFSEKNVSLKNISNETTQQTVRKNAPKVNSTKAKVTVRSDKQMPETLKPTQRSMNTVSGKVHYYDHPNRFFKEYSPDIHNVEPIHNDSLIASPNLVSEEELNEKMRQRDIEARIRGQVALGKEKIQREYRELFRKLPVLHKQERICEVGVDREKYHMSKERLEEFKKKRQNRLDNAYEEMFVRTQPGRVTIPSENDQDTPPSLNLADWDVDLPIKRTQKPARDINEDRSDQLSTMLDNLKEHKKHLMDEIENTFSKDVLSQFSNGRSVDYIKSKSTHYSGVKKKRKRGKDDNVLSPNSSDFLLGGESESRVNSSRSGTEKNIPVGANENPSPRKKAKLRTKRKKLILQNISTQTTPTCTQESTPPLCSTDTNSNSKKEKKEPCDCQTIVADDVCQILIKITNDEEPQVTINPPSAVQLNEEKSSNTLDMSKEKTAKIQDGAKEEFQQKPKPVSPHKKKKSTTPLWRDHFSRSSSLSTASTSYMDPPDFIKISMTSSDKSKETFSTIAPTDVSRINADRVVSSDDSRRIIDSRLLKYIKKLLDMSRASIDNLSVSSASGVSTPSQSVVETPTNNPLLQLRNVIRYFNLDPAEVQKQLDNFSDAGSVHYNTSESVTINSSSTPNDERTIQFKSCIDLNLVKDKHLEEASRRYVDVAETCSKKISNLTAMIEKVRAEKKKILQSSSNSDKDQSSYMDLPETMKDQPAASQDEADILQIDLNYAQKLKKMTPAQLAIEKQRGENVDRATDQELLKRLQRLLQPPKDVNEKDKSEKEQSNFVPLLLDIPKLPKFESSNKKKHPPPTRNIRSLNGNVPHELSTIVEADSQLSAKLDSPVKENLTPPSPLLYKRSKSPSKKKSPPIKSKSPIRSISDSKSTSSSPSSGVPDILADAAQIEPKMNSSDDKSELESMEAMLQSIGMEWAIPTLRKTRETLAHSSTSSESGSKKDTSNSIELSLKDIFQKVSVGKTSNRGSPASSLSLSQEVSLMKVESRRTSTPVQGYKDELSYDKRGIFSTESDMSSVREHSKKESEEADNGGQFFDLNEGSLSKTG